MKLPHERQPDLEVIDFYDALLSDRFDFCDRLKPYAYNSYATWGYTGKMYTLPEVLLPYFASDNTDTSVAVEWSTDPSGSFSLEQITLEPEDAPKISLSYDGFATCIRIDDRLEIDTLVLGEDLLGDTLNCLLPRQKHGDPQKIVEAIRQFSPEQQHLMRLELDGNILEYRETETAKNSAHSIVISTPVAHPNGQPLMFRTTVQESLQSLTEGRRSSLSEFDVNIASQREFIFEELCSGKNIRVPRPTRLHVQAFKNALNAITERCESK